MRGFEWYWLNGALHDEQRVIPSRHEEAYTVAFSPDGNRLYSGGKDGVIRIWNPRTGTLVAEMPGHTSCVNQIAFTMDGSKLISVGCDNTAHVWSVADRIQIGLPWPHSQVVCCLAVAHNRPWVATGANDGQARVWNYETGEVIATLVVQSGQHAVNAMAFSPDDETLCGCAFETVFWDTSKWQESSRLALNAMTFAFDRAGKQLIMGTSRSQVIAWDGAAGAGPHLLHQFPSWVHAVAVSPVQDFFVAGGQNGSLRVLDLNGGLRRVLNGGTAHIQCLSFSPDGRYLAASDYEGMLRVWDLNRDGMPIAVAPSQYHYGIVVSREGPWLAANDIKPCTNICDRRTGEIANRYQGAHCVLLSAKGNLAVTREHGSHDVWIVKMPSMERVLLLDKGHTDGKSICISHDERTAAVADPSGKVRVVGIPSGKAQCAAQINLTYGSEFQRIVLSPDGSRLIWADGHLIGRQAIDTETGNLVPWPDDMRFVTSAACFPYPIVCSPDARQSANETDDNGVAVIEIYDSGSGELIHRLRHKDALSGAVTWSPTGKRIAVLTKNDALVLFDSAIGAQVAELDGGLETTITGPMFDAQGETITTWTAGKNGLLRNVWHAPRHAADGLAR